MQNHHDSYQELQNKVKEKLAIAYEAGQIEAEDVMVILRLLSLAQDEAGLKAAIALHAKESSLLAELDQEINQ